MPIATPRYHCSTSIIPICLASLCAMHTIDRHDSLQYMHGVLSSPTSRFKQVFKDLLQWGHLCNIACQIAICTLKCGFKMNAGRGPWHGYCTPPSPSGSVGPLCQASSSCLLCAFGSPAPLFQAPLSQGPLSHSSCQWHEKGRCRPDYCPASAGSCCAKWCRSCKAGYQWQATPDIIREH